MAIALTVVFLVLVIVAVIYVFLIMPRVSGRADMDLISSDYAHRGLHSLRNPENSLAAFNAAMLRGYGIELDVRLTADGQVVVFHDANTMRMCGVDKNVRDATLDELRNLRLKGTAYTVPTLNEVLALVDGRTPLLIEIKGDGAEDKLCRAVSSLLDTYSGPFAIQAFSPLALAWFKRYRPGYARGQLVTKLKRIDGKKFPRFSAFAVSGMLTNVRSRPDFISINGAHINNPAFLICTKLFKCRGFVWTVRKNEQYKHIHKLGLFAIFEKSYLIVSKHCVSLTPVFITLVASLTLSL